MFTEIVEDIGKVQNIKKSIKLSVIDIEENKIFEHIHFNVSIITHIVKETVLFRKSTGDIVNI